MKMGLRGSLLVQHVIGQIGVFIIGPLYFSAIRLMGYRVRNLRKIRKDFACHFRNHEGPWIICANHLTMIDSMILTYVMMSLFRHFTQFRLIPWNLPERSNFQRNIILTVLCYLAKCIPINRGGDREEMKRTLDKCTSILAGKQFLQIFPEGGRSRTGRINTESFSYGVGRFVKDFENCRVMCIYLRGDGQHTYGFMPRFGEHLTVKIDVFQPQLTEQNGLKAQRYYAEQIIKHLACMEEDYFSSRRQRYCGSERSEQHGKEQECAVRQPGFHIQ
ncbi:MAG: lysophospholipid acyltransferase family protein [Deltaproteobacteria bacterium]|nr:lysophospholipid acyltransferase family protein [Deltaproteobacteria bacterium]